LFTFATIVAALTISTAAPAADLPAPRQPFAPGAEVLNFSLIDYHGKNHDLRRTDAKVVVLFFTTPGCPIARQNAPKLQAIADRFREQGVVVWMVNAAPQNDPGDTQLDGPFDLIWVGSLFTHLDPPRWRHLLDLFERVLAPEGLLIFTTQGRFIRDQIANRAWRDAYGRPIWENWGVTEDELDRPVAAYDHDGFGYIEWEALDRTYGTSIATPAWVLQQLQTRPGLRIAGYRERAWGAQDVVACVGAGG